MARNGSDGAVAYCGFQPAAKSMFTRETGEGRRVGSRGGEGAGALKQRVGRTGDEEAGGECVGELVATDHAFWAVEGLHQWSTIPCDGCLRLRIVKKDESTLSRPKR